MGRYVNNLYIIAYHFFYSANFFLTPPFFSQEFVMGVTLGQEGTMIFIPQKEKDKKHLTTISNGKQKSVRVQLPRRSMYIMSGQSRTDWKHGIMKQKPTNQPPVWNKLNMRKSLTFRSTKVFSDVYLERQIQIETDPMKRQELVLRQTAQAKFKPVGGYGGPKLTKDEIDAERKKSLIVLQHMELG